MKYTTQNSGLNYNGLPAIFLFEEKKILAVVVGESEEEMQSNCERIIKALKRKPLKQTQSNPAYPLCIEIYDNFCKQRLGVGAKIDGEQGKAMKLIIEYIRGQIKGEVNETIIAGAWNTILGNFAKWSAFNQRNLKLSQINSNLLNIINEIRNSSSANGNSNQISDEFRRRNQEIIDGAGVKTQGD